MENQLPIVLIGPICAGKSTIAELLAEKLAITRYELDEHRWSFYQEIGYDEAEASQIASKHGMTGLMNYWKPFEAYAVERVIATQANCVIDFGAGHSVYEDATLFERVATALAPCPYVILVMPSPNRAESLAILNNRFEALLKREGIPITPELLQLNEQFINHPSNERLAKQTVYTYDKTPEQTTAEIITLLQSS